MAKRIAIIGARGFANQTDDYQIECIPWDSLIKLPNLSDYDAIIINLIPLEEDQSRRDSVDWAAFSYRMHPRSAADVLLHHGQIIVLGDPRFSIQWKDREGTSHDEPFLYWSGITFKWKEESGKSNDDSFQVYDDRNRFGAYLLNSVGCAWSYFLVGCEVNIEVAKLFFNFDVLTERRIEARVHRSDYRQNRYKGALAFEACHQLIRRHRNRSWEEDSAKVVVQLGSIIVLPRTPLEDEESIAMILRDAFKVEVVLSEPEWIGRTVVPGQPVIDAAMEELRTQFNVLVDKYESLKVQRVQKRHILRLLFDRGTSLETVVRGTLRELGGQVEDPTDPGQEDGWVTIQLEGQTKSGVIEVKGTAKDKFNEDGLNQLYKWKLRGIQIRNTAYKGIFIGNCSDERPPDERSLDPFSQNFKDHAKLQEAVVILTTDLYVVYQLKEAGLLNREEFWTDVFSTNGIFNASKYRLQLQRDMK